NMTAYAPASPSAPSDPSVPSGASGTHGPGPTQNTADGPPDQQVYPAPSTVKFTPSTSCAASPLSPAVAASEAVSSAPSVSPHAARPRVSAVSADSAAVGRTRSRFRIPQS